MKNLKRFRKPILTCLASLLVLWAICAGFLWVTAWKPLDRYEPTSEHPLAAPILNAEDYGKLIDRHARPFIVMAETTGTNSGAVLVYGSEHTNDPSSPTLQNIEDEFKAFEPSVVLCEGRMTGLLFPLLMDPTATFGESGFVRALAYQSGCDVYTWEPSPKQEVDGLLEQGFTVEQVSLRVYLNGYFSNLRFGRPEDPESFVMESVKKKSGWPTIGDQFQSIDDLEVAWKRQFPDGPDWRDVSDEYGLPGFLGEMDGNLARDQHLFQIIMELVAQGERVFVVAGSSHAVKLEQAVRESCAALVN